MSRYEQGKEKVTELFKKLDRRLISPGSLEDEATDF